MTNFAKYFAQVWRMNWFYKWENPYQSQYFSKVVYKFVFANCNASYIGQTCRHLTTTKDEHFGKYKKSHIYQNFMSPTDYLDRCSKDWFCFRQRQHRVSIKNKGMSIHHKAGAKASSIHHVIFFLSSFSFVLFAISFNFTVWLICLIAVFSCFYIWKLYYYDIYVNFLYFVNTITF